MTIDVEIPVILNPQSESEKRKILSWLGKLTRAVFSKSFKLYEEGTLNREKMRAFCSENMLFNLINREIGPSSVYRGLNIAVFFVFIGHCNKLVTLLIIPHVLSL